MVNQIITLVLGFLGSAGALLGGIAAYRKWGPEARKINVDVMDVNVRVASDLRDDAWESWHRIRNEMDALRNEFDQYRKDTEIRMTELSTALRSERALREHVQEENGHIRTENKHLRDRVASLEAEVSSLKSYNNRN